MSSDDRQCAWCGEPATNEIELEPQRMGTRKHPSTGMTMKVPIERAKTAYVCDAHAGVRDRTGGVAIRDPRGRKAKVEQIDIEQMSALIAADQRHAA